MPFVCLASLAPGARDSRVLRRHGNQIIFSLEFISHVQVGKCASTSVMFTVYEREKVDICQERENPK